jgi:D-alanyl-D-alanine carboxypeptidase
MLALCLLFVFRNSASTPDEKKNQKQSAESQTESFDKSQFPTDKPDSIWVVVNKQRPLDPLDFEPGDLVAAGNQRLRREAAAALQTMRDKAAEENLPLLVISGYRSYGTQQSVYAREVANYGQETADMQSARPGHSEHQTGLAVDVGGGGCGIEDCFGETAEGKWVAAHAHEYGFIVRYVPGKEDITGYKPEPWHIRYVGKELAAEMKRQNIQTLEEFFQL